MERLVMEEIQISIFQASSCHLRLLKYLVRHTCKAHIVLITISGKGIHKSAKDMGKV